MNDLPLADIPPNVTNLQRTQHGAPVPAEPDLVSVLLFDVGSSPFTDTFTKTLTVPCSRPDFGLTIAADDLNNCAFVSGVVANSNASCLFSSHKATTNKIRGAYIICINDKPMFTANNVCSFLCPLSDSRPVTVDIAFAPEKRASASAVRRAAAELKIFTPSTTLERASCSAHLPCGSLRHLLCAIPQ